VRLVTPEKQTQLHVVAALEAALARAKRGEFADVIIAATAKGANNFYLGYSSTTDTPKRVGLLTMALDDMMSDWRAR
jgi:hypothetical protein